MCEEKIGGMSILKRTGINCDECRKDFSKERFLLCKVWKRIFQREQLEEAYDESTW